MAAVETDFLSDATNEKPIACSDDEKETNGSKARECPSNLHREKSISPTIDSEQTSAGSRICQQTNRELETKPKGGKEEYDKCQAGDIECHSSIDILPEKNCAEKANTLKDYFINSRQMETLDSNNGNGEKHRCPENEQDAVNQDKQSHFSRESVYKSSAQLIEAAQGSSMKSTTQRSQLPNFLQVENGSISFISVPSNVLAASPGSDAPKKKQKCEPKVKKEPQDDIKEYAESTMNELLGWYGLPKMDKVDTPKLSLDDTYPNPSTTGISLLSKAEAYVKSTPAENIRSALAVSSRTAENTAIAGSTVVSPKTVETVQQRAVSESNIHPNSVAHKLDSSVPITDSMNTTAALPARSSHLATDRENSSGQKRTDGVCLTVDKLRPDMTPESPSDTNNNSDGFGGPGGTDEEDFAEDDDQEDDDVNDEIKNLASPDLGPSDLGSAIVCSWCQRDGTKLYTLATPAGIKAFCSEVCFTQCRRASFKKNKICDWCKHVRHTVNFVDLQEGDMQLQFCSEKCLNQYKMNIFCTEARQHLEHMQKMTGDSDKKVGRSKGSKGEILITPELWLSGASSGDCEIKKEKPDICDDIGDGDDNEEQERANEEDEEEKEPGEVTEKENSSDPMRKTITGVSVNRQKKTSSLNHKYICNQEIKKQIEKPNIGGAEHQLHPYIRESSSRESPRVLASPNAPPPATLSRTQLRGRNQRRSRERIRRLLVGEPLDRPCSPQSDGRDIVLSPHRYSHVDAGTKRAASNSTAAAVLPGQHLLGHPMLQHWATSQLLAMLPSIPPPLPGSLPTPSAAARLASLGYATNGSQMLYPTLFGAASLRPTVADESASAQGQQENIQSRGLNALRSESTPVSLPSRNSLGDGVGNRKSTDPSPLSPSPSQSSTETPVPSTVLPTPPPASDLIQLMTSSNGHDPVNELGTFQSYLATHARLPSGLPPLPVHPQHFSRLPPFYHDALGAHPEIPHNFTPRSNINSRTEDASRQTPHPSQGQSIPPHSFPQPFPQPAGVPPVTVLVPYPVAVPIPIPIPIPLPISPEKLFAFFEEKSRGSNSGQAEQNNTDKANSASTRHRSQSSSSSGSKMSGSSPVGLSPLTPRYPGWTVTSASGRAPSSSSTSSSRGDHCLVTTNEHGDPSDSITALRREIGKTTLLAPQDIVASPSTPTASPSLKRPPQTSLHQLQFQTLSIDLSKRARANNSPSCSQEEETEAMDLRKPSSRSESPRDMQACGKPGRFSNGATSENRPLSGAGVIPLSGSPIAQNKLFPPRIHIVLNEEPPLGTNSEMNGSSNAFSATLPPLPDQSTYSNRRSRILDAPSIPRKTARSPSPERRYVRTVPRDMVEAARRRGLRARVRTK